MLIELEISSKDESFPWFLYWMTTHQRAQLPGSSLHVADKRNKKYGIMESFMNQIKPRTHFLSLSTQKVQHPNGSIETRFLFLPGLGRHLLRYKNAFFLVNRVRETKSMDLQTGTPWETITLTTLYFNRHVFEDVFAETSRLARQATEGKTILYTPRTASWERFGEPRTKRPLDSVILDKGIKERIVTDIRRFQSSEKWYQNRGIPYRRGYLLHGLPGSGKSSFIQALAGELDYNIAILNLAERGMTDDRLNHLLSIVPQRTLVLLEDADAGFDSNRRQTDTQVYSGSNLTFAGLLNALDGVASAEERIIFLTTNHIERLDSALIRPGRVDMTVRLGEVTRWQAERLWRRFYGDLDGNGALEARFLEQLEQLGCIERSNGEKKHPERTTTAAALQGLFLYNMDDPEGAIAMVQDRTIVT